MIHHREKAEVKRFDIFKLIVLIILILLLLWFWLSPPAFVQGPDDGMEDTAVATQPDTPTQPESDSSSPQPDPLPTVDPPTLESPSLADGLEAGSVTLSGSGTPGSTVRISLDGVEVGSADVAADGRWTFDLPLAAGSRTLTLAALDADGALAHTVNLPPFAVASPAAPLDIPTLTLPEGALLGGTLSLSGSGTPGSEVGVVVDGELVGSAVVGPDGTWSLDTDLAAGDYDLRLQAIDLNGSVAGESDGFALSLGQLTPPDFELPDLGLNAGDLEFAGVGTPGATMELLANGEVVGTAVVADDGTWVIPANLEAGDYDLSLRMLDATGNLLAESDGRSTTVAAAGLDFVLPTVNLPTAELAGGDVTLSGSGAPGAELAIVVNGEVVGTAVVADDGTWNFSTNLPAGDYEVALRTVDGEGTAVETDSISLTLAAEAPTLAEPAASSSAAEAASLPADFCADAEPGIDQGDTYIVARCEWLTKIANRLSIPYANLIGVNPQISNPNLIYPGQVINLPPR